MAGVDFIGSRFLRLAARDGAFTRKRRHRPLFIAFHLNKTPVFAQACWPIPINALHLLKITKPFYI